MAKIGRLFVYLIALVTISGSSCRDPVQAVSIQNKTDRVISYKAFFKSDHGNDTVEYTLHPGVARRWDYTVPQNQTNEIDPALEKVIFEVEDDCVITVSRKELQEWSDGSGWAWDVPLTPERMYCDAPTRS